MNNNEKNNNNSIQSVVTFGCRLNSYESQIIKNLLKESSEIDNRIVINTCSVTSEAERQARQVIRKIKRENPDLQIIVTGCAAQINPDQFKSMPEVDRVLGNDAKLLIESYFSKEKVIVNNYKSIRTLAKHLISGFDGRSRAYVQIQNGCNYRCSFCVIPFGRGISRSSGKGEIITQIHKLIQNGYQEIVLTGVNITSYGIDLPGKPKLGDLVRSILFHIPELKRIRLSSLDPAAIDESLFKIILSEPRLMPHLHFSLQSGDNFILKKMKRRHSREDMIQVCDTIRNARPDIVFGADIIVGFPTETEEMAENTLSIVDECDLSYLHVFPYSQRQKTPASYMDQVSKEIIEKRSEKLRRKGDYVYNLLLEKYQGSMVNVLIESDSSDKNQDFLYGKTDHFTPILIKKPNNLRVNKGDIKKVYINGIIEKKLKGLFI